MWAADQGHAAAIQLLIQRGADIQSAIESGRRLEERRPGQIGRSRKDARTGRSREGVPAGQQADGRTAGSSRRSPRPDPRRRAAWRGPRASPPLPRDGQGRQQPARDLTGGALTALAYATRANSLESVKVLLAAGVDVNQTTGYGWSPLLVATQNRYYQLGSFCSTTART